MSAAWLSSCTPHAGGAVLRPLLLRTLLPATLFLLLPHTSHAQSGDRAPLVTAPGSVTVKLGFSTSFVVTASDPDGSAIVSLTASGTALDAGASFTVNAANTMGTLNWTPAWEGTFSATFTAANALLGTATTTVRVSGDHAPMVTAPPTLAGVTYAQLSFTVTVSDPDGDPSTLYAAGLPLGAEFNTYSNGPNPAGDFVWTPGLDQEGSYSVHFTALASNGSAGSARTEIVITERQQPIGSPYMFMDTNGDGAFDETDKMNPNGVPTTIDVWVSTMATRTGASTVCNTLDGSLGTWNSYVANIGVVGGTVTFGTPANQQSTFTISAVPFNASDTEMTFGQAGQPTTAGFQRMFTIEVTGVSGNPSLVFMPRGHLGPEPTSFGTPCSGLDHDGGYKLATDWFEAIGALPSTGPSGPNLVRNPSFEASTLGWKGLDGGTIQRVAGGHDGSYSLEVEGPADSTGKFSVNDSPNWVARAPATGTIYRFAAWVRSAASAGKARLRVRQYLNQVRQSILWSAPVKLGPTWQKVTLDVTAVAAGATLDLQVMDAPLAPAEVFQTDDISIWTLFKPFGVPESPAVSGMDAVVVPNPLNPDAVLSFTTQQDGPIMVRIYDVSGRLVRTLSEPALAAGRQALLVDGKDASGRRLASGVYFFRIEAGHATATGRFAIVK
jgi:flagellar hook capping protein FlgD/putative Ig domain-containing protein